MSRKKEISSALNTAMRERGKKREEALTAWLSENGDEALEILADLPFSGGMQSAKKAALKTLAALDWAGHQDIGAITAAKSLQKKAKDYQVLYKAIVAAGVDPVAISEQIRGSLAYIGSKDATAMVAAADEAPVLRVLSQHWDSDASKAALKKLGSAAKNPWQGCPLSVDARRGLCLARARTSPPDDVSTNPVAWMEKSVVWPEGTFGHSRLEHKFSLGWDPEIVGSDGHTYIPLGYIDVTQVYLAFRAGDSSSDPKVYDVDSDSTVRGVGWNSMSSLFKILHFRGWWS